MQGELSLDKVAVGCCCEVVGMSVHGAMRRRLLDIGFIEGELVRCVGEAPSGDPKAFEIRGAVIAIRKEDCRYITVRKSERGERHGAYS